MRIVDRETGRIAGGETVDTAEQLEVDSGNKTQRQLG